MNKFYSLATFMITSLTIAQTTITFEESEAYILGNINGQNGWTVTETSDGFLTNQVISNTVSKSGSFSFKNANVPEYNPQWLPIMGAEKSFETPIDYKKATISYDFYGTELMGSDFEFAIYSTNQETQEYDILLATGFDYNGHVYMYTKKNFNEGEYDDGYVKVENKWVKEKWYNVKIETTETTVSFYLDNELLYTGENDSKMNIEGITILHNNYGGDAYYDNIVATDQDLSVTDFNSGKTKFYPNPVKDILKIDLPKGESSNLIEVYNTVGQKITQFMNINEINLSNLKSGLYIINVKSTSGKTYSSKIIKQ